MMSELPREVEEQVAAAARCASFAANASSICILNPSSKVTDATALFLSQEAEIQSVHVESLSTDTSLVALGEAVSTSTGVSSFSISSYTHSNKAILSAAAIAATAPGSRVRCLRIDSCKMYATDLIKIAAMIEKRGSGALAELRVPGNELSLAAYSSLARTLTKTPGIQLLDLSRNPVANSGAIQVANMIKGCPTLTSIVLHECKITAAGFKAIGAAMRCCRDMIELDLSKNEAGDPGIVGISDPISHHNGLETLNLADTKMGDEGVKAITGALARNYGLRQLDLANNVVSDGAAVAGLCSLLLERGSKGKLNRLSMPSNKNSAVWMKILTSGLTEDRIGLRHLSLSENKMGSESMAALAEALSTNSMLTDLDLSHCAIGLEGIKALVSGLSKNNCITNLSLYWNPLGVEGMKAVAGLLSSAKGRRIASLNVGRTKLGQEGLIIIAKALAGNSTLKELRVDRSGLGRGSAKHMAELISGMRGLHTLNLSSNSMYKDNMQPLVTALAQSRTLKVLIMNDMQLENAGMSMLIKSLAENDVLDELQVRYNDIGNESMADVCEFLKTNSRLRKIDLSYNAVGHSGTICLAEGVRENAGGIKELVVNYCIREGEDVEEFRTVCAEAGVGLVI